MTAVLPALAQETVSDRRPPRRRLAVVVAGLVICGLAFMGRGSAAAATPAQDPAASTTAPVATTVTPTSAPAGPDAGKVAAEDRQIWLVVAGLVAVAVALMLLTIRYWRQTRPVPVVASEPGSAQAAETAAPVADVTAGEATAVVATAVAPPVRPEGRHSRRAVAGADHAAADEAWEPRATGEHERIDVPAARRTTRPTTEQRAAAFRAAAEAG